MQKSDKICWLHSAINGGDVLRGTIKKIDGKKAFVKLNPNYIRAGLPDDFELNISSIMLESEFDEIYKKLPFSHHKTLQIFLDHSVK